MDWETSPEANEAKLEFGKMFKTEKEEPVDNFGSLPMNAIKEETPDPESDDWHEFAEWAEEFKFVVPKKEEKADTMDVEYEEYESMSGKK